MSTEGGRQPTDAASTALDPSEYFVMGTIHSIQGIVGVMLNAYILFGFLANRHPLCKARSLLGISLSIGDLGIALMCPFTAVACFRETWVYGNGGCQLYACAGMLFGAVSITSLVSLAVDKCCSISRGSGLDAAAKPYSIVTMAIWINAIIWAVAPLNIIGWGRYSLEPSGIACLLDFACHDVTCMTYLAAMMGVVYVLPVGVVLRCLMQLWAEEGSDKKQAEKKNALKVCILVLLSLAVYWGPYGIVALWAAADDMKNVPIRLVAVASITAKMCPIGNAVLQKLTNQVAPHAADKQK